MEEILASIRRIIADDETPAAAAVASPATAGGGAVDAESAVPAGAPDDVLELTDRVQPAPSAGTAEVEFGEPEAAPAPPPPPPRAEAAPPPKAEPVALRPASRPAAEGLLSPAANDAASSAFAALAHTVLAENSRTLEDLVHEMLRPMLKTWLDDNLPALVERLVRQEIERVSRGGRR
ncbi:MAG TPA: DUF2497 domain-containing protein [Hyphomicrobiales bacterium]|nr:DUF2497 domain-containing protein [Hyphomicrobiales bacterium]